MSRTITETPAGTIALAHPDTRSVVTVQLDITTPADITTQADEHFAFWRDALRGSFGAIHENDPQSGFWRTKPDRQGQSFAVAIWREDGKVYALRQGRPTDPSEIWTWCCQRPIPYDLYLRVAEFGEPWPDALPAIGHNSGALVPAQPPWDLVTPGTGPAASLAEAISDLWKNARDWLAAVGTITTRELADRAANFATRFAELQAEAEEHRTRLKRPVLQQAASIDQLWKPIVENAEQAKSAMKVAVEPYLEAEWDLIQIDGHGPGIEPPSAGTYGRRVSLRTQHRVQVKNPTRLVRHYAGDGRFHGDPQVQKVTQKLAQGDLSSGKAVPGAKLISSRRVV